MHAEAFTYVANLVSTLPPRFHVVEFGGRNFNGSVRPLFPQARSYLSIDLFPGPGVDGVGDALTWDGPEFGGQSPDTVVCCEMLEHAPEWPELVKHAHQILSEHGVLILTCAAPPRAPHSGYDGLAVRDGEHYANVEPTEFKKVMDAVQWADYAMAVAERGDLYCCARK